MSKTSIIVSLVCFAAAGFLCFRELQFLSKAETAMGTVKTIYTDWVPDHGGHTSYCSLIEFTTKMGETVVYNPQLCSDQPLHQIGEQLKIYYDPLNPEFAKLDSFQRKYFGTLVLGGYAMAILLMNPFDSMVKYFLKIKSKRRIAK